MKETRDSARAERAVAELTKACKTSENIVPYTVEAVKAKATLGETFGAIKEGFGFWNPPTRYKGGA